MIRLTHESGKSIYINPDKIVDIFSTETGHAQLLFVIGEGYRVTESPEEIARKVLEYRLAMVRYGALAKAYAAENNHELAGYIHDDMHSTEEGIMMLAGLEEQNHD